MSLPDISSHRIYRPTVVTIDLDALGHNYYQIRSLLPKGVKIYAIVKADAYGHGAIYISRELEQLGVDGLGVATVEEGLELRKAGIKRPILLMSAGIDGLEEAIEHSLTPVIYSKIGLRVVSEIARRRGFPIGVHIKIDTGMGRLGFLPEEWNQRTIS